MKKSTKNSAKTNKTATQQTTAQQVKEIAKDAATTGNAESSMETAKADDLRGEGQSGNEQAQTRLAQTQLLPFVDSEDLLTCTKNSLAWNSNPKNTLPEIKLFTESCVLGRYEVIPTPLFVGNKQTPFSILTCSDNGNIVGKPFNPKTYSLFDNHDMQETMQQLFDIADKRGWKPEIVASLTLMNRERQSLTMKLNCPNAETEIEGRKIASFFNLLNSIPSSQGCTIVFANNTFTVCCRNTFAHCLTGKDGARLHCSVKHSKGMKIALNDIEIIFDAYISNNDTLFKNLKTFVEFPVGLVDCETYFAAFLARDNNDQPSEKSELSVRTANMIQTLQTLFVKGKGNKGENAFDLFNAVTEYYTHFSAGDSNDPMKQIQSSESMGASGYTAKNTFYNWLVKHVQDKSNFNAVCRVGDKLLVSYLNKAKAKA